MYGLMKEGRHSLFSTTRSRSGSAGGRAADEDLPSMLSGKFQAHRFLIFNSVFPVVGSGQIFGLNFGHRARGYPVDSTSDLSSVKNIHKVLLLLIAYQFLKGMLHSITYI